MKHYFTLSELQITNITNRHRGMITQDHIDLGPHTAKQWGVRLKPWVLTHIETNKIIKMHYFLKTVDTW